MKNLAAIAVSAYIWVTYVYERGLGNETMDSVIWADSLFLDLKTRQGLVWRVVYNNY